MSTEFYRCGLCQMASEDEDRFTSIRLMGAPFTEEMMPTCNGGQWSETDLVYCDLHESHDDENRCCLCLEGIPEWEWTNNPSPIVSQFTPDGNRRHCCDRCNRAWVIPARYYGYIYKAEFTDSSTT